MNLLNQLPSLNRLVLHDVYCIDEIPKDFKLTLQKLTQIDLRNCNGNVLKALDRLPDGVLNMIHMRQELFDNKNLFLNQFNVKHVEVYGQGKEIMNFKSMKLKSLYIGRFKVNWNEITEGQTELKSLKFKGNLTTGDLEIIIKNLKSLEQFKLSHLLHLHPHDWSSMQFAKNLRSLEVNAINESFLTLQSKTLQELSVARCNDFKLSEANVATISYRCPNLRAIRIDEPTSVTVFNSILLHFPQLKVLSLKFDYFEFFESVEPLQHHGLKELRVRIRHIHPVSILESIGMTLKLETFEMSIDVDEFHEFDDFDVFDDVHEIDAHLMYNVLSTQPNLTVLRLFGSFKFHSDMIDTFKNFGKNLVGFEIDAWRGHENLKMLAVGLASQFPVTYPEGKDCRHLIMKRNKNIKI